MSRAHVGLVAVSLLFMVTSNVPAFELRMPPRTQLQPFSISFDAVPGTYYDIEASTNLVSWSVLRTLRGTTSSAVWEESDPALPSRFFRVADLSEIIVVEGEVRTADGIGVPEHCPFCDVLVSSSLDGETAHTDSQGRYILKTRSAAAATNVPFTLYFSKVGYRAQSALVTDPTSPRLDIMSLAGPLNNDFTNRLVVSGSETNRDDNTQADIERDEPGLEPSLWYSFTAPRDGTLRFVVDTTEFFPTINLYKGDTLPALQLVERGALSNYVEWRIETTRDVTVYAGEQFQVRVGAQEHPTRGLTGGIFEWRAAFEPDFPLSIQAWNTNQGAIVVTPLPNGGGRYAPGQTVTLSAFPAPNYIFAGWNGSIVAPQANVTFAMNEAKTVSAVFQLANGNFSNAIPLTGEAPAAEAWVPLDGSVWYEWTAPRTMPVALAYDTTNFLHGSVYRVDEGNLTPIANNLAVSSDHKETTFWAEEGATYKFAVNFEANEVGFFRLQAYEPIVARGRFSGLSGYALTLTLSFTTNRYFLWGYRNQFEIWTRIPATPDYFPYAVSVKGQWYRPTGGIVYSNAQYPTYTISWFGPSNNDMSNAVTLASSSGSVSGTYRAADTEPGEPGVGVSIWYRFVPPEDGTLFITNNIRSTLEISAFRGAAVEALEPLPGLVHERNAYTSISEWSAYAGQPLVIRCGGLDGLPGSLSMQYRFVPGFPLFITSAQPLAATIEASPEPDDAGRFASGQSVTLTATPHLPYLFRGWTGAAQSSDTQVTFTMDALKSIHATFGLPNDLFADAQVVAGLPAFGAGANLYAAAEPGEPFHGGWEPTSSVWYRWTAPVSGDVLIDFDFVDVSIIATVYRGTALANLVPVAINYAGRNIRHVSFTAQANATYHLAVDAYNGHGGPFSFNFKALEEARYILNVRPSEGGYVELSPAPDGNAEYGAGTDVTLRAVPVNDSWFVVWEDLTYGTYERVGTNQVLTVRMDQHRILRPVFATLNPRLNDHFSDRRILLADGRFEGATNVAATAEAGEPLHHVGSSGRSLWWSWTAYTTAPIAFTTFGSGFTNVVAIYRGDSVTNLLRVASGDPGLESSATFEADAGTTYHIAVDGVGGQAGVMRLRAVENEQIFAGIASPAPQASWSEPAIIPVQAHAINSQLTITQVALFTNGVLAFTSSEPAPLFLLTNPAPGLVVLSVTAIDAAGRIAMSSPFTNFVHGYRFMTNVVVAKEGEGRAGITISRSQPYNVPSQVWFETAPGGTATTGIHYTPISGPVQFRPNEQNRFVTVPLLRDPAPEVDRTLFIQLRSNPASAVTHSASFIITDTTNSTQIVLVEDFFPPDATASGDYSWISTNPTPVSGALARRSSGQHGYTRPYMAPYFRQAGDVLWQDVYLDPQSPPTLLGIAVQTGYGHRWVYWGDRSLIQPWDTWLGPLPPTGAWYQITFPSYYASGPESFGLVWTVQGGTAAWDRTGIWR